MISLIRRAVRHSVCLTTSVLLATIITSGQIHAFDELNEAQSLIYDSNHLANTSQGQILNYLYAAEDIATQSVTDKASLSITASHDDGRRDIDIDFLSDERHLPLPSFSGYRGNPVIIAMLEHIAQSISTQTGGGALYFRNRIRDALASEDVELEQRKIRYNDRELAATRITFYPFTRDQYIGSNELMSQSRFSIDLSDGVPGGVFMVQVKASHETQVFERTLSLQ